LKLVYQNVLLKYSAKRVGKQIHFKVPSKSVYTFNITEKLRTVENINIVFLFVTREGGLLDLTGISLVWLLGVSYVHTLHLLLNCGHSECCLQQVWGLHLLPGVKILFPPNSSSSLVSLL